MKNARIHFIYLAIIGFLAYQYWTKAQALNEAVGSIEQFDKLIKTDTRLLNSLLDREIDYAEHNYNRAKNQLTLLRQLEVFLADNYNLKLD